MRVLVVAAGTMAQAGMAALVDSAPGAEVVAAVAPPQAVAVAAELLPDVCLVDAEGGAEELLVDLVAGVSCPVVAVAETDDFPGLLATGVTGVVTPGIGAEALEAAFHAAAAGVGIVFPADAFATDISRGPSPPRNPDGVAPVEELTPRERDVLALVADGLTNQQLARRLGISEHTAKFHVASVLGKLGARSRAEAVTAGYRAGLISI